jgi:predicted amidohydrolase
MLLIVVLLCSQTGGADSSASASGLKVASCQFPVSGNVDENARYIKGFIEKAAACQAEIVHFSEAALSGYAGVDVPNFDNYDWHRLRTHTQEIMGLAKEHRIWIVLGSAHYLCPDEKPTNCLYIISGEGEIVDRYDKSMCTGGDLNSYTPGNHLVTIDLKGIRCGFLICYDSCFPEMYNVYRHRGVQLMFHSFYNARHKGKTILDEIIPAEIRVRASDNLMWVVANNSSADHSAWPTCIARPDGSLTALERGVPGILYRTFPDKKVTDEFRFPWESPRFPTLCWTHTNRPAAPQRPAC